MVLWLLHEQWTTGYNDLEFNLKTPCTLAHTNLSCVNVWAYWKKVNVFETVHFSNFCTLQFWVIPSLNIGNKKQLGPSISFLNVFGILFTTKRCSLSPSSTLHKGQAILNAIICFSILPKNERNSLSWVLRKEAQDSKFRSFFGRIDDTTNCFWDLLTFIWATKVTLRQQVPDGLVF